MEVSPCRPRRCCGATSRCLRALKARRERVMGLRWLVTHYLKRLYVVHPKGWASCRYPRGYLKRSIVGEYEGGTAQVCNLIGALYFTFTRVGKRRYTSCSAQLSALSFRSRHFEQMNMNKCRHRCKSPFKSKSWTATNPATAVCLISLWCAVLPLLSVPTAHDCRYRLPRGLKIGSLNSS